MAPLYVTSVGRFTLLCSAALRDWVGLHSALSAEFKTAVTLTLQGGFGEGEWERLTASVASIVLQRADAHNT